MVDRDLFVHNLAVVAIMKDEEPYVKEWLDYHLLAGVDHFYIYDNDSTPEFKKILQPYIDAGIVTYTFFPGKARQMEAYNDAIQKYKFLCRYMAFIDGDEFIFPKMKPTIIEIVDKVLSDLPDAAGLQINWMPYGSNGEEKADYTRGVLERFTRRNILHDNAIKSIVNPRRVNFFWTPHFPVYFERISDVSLNSSDKIIVNHYHVKSREEWDKKLSRGRAAYFDRKYGAERFAEQDYNAVFDDGIVNYQKSRYDALIPPGEGIESLFKSKQKDYRIIFAAIDKNLSPAFKVNTPRKFFDNKIETILTCMGIAFHAGENGLISKDDVEFLLDSVCNAMNKALAAKFVVADLNLAISSMPETLSKPYRGVDKFREIYLQTLDNWKQILQSKVKKDQDLALWQKISDLNYTYRILKSFDSYEKK